MIQSTNVIDNEVIFHDDYLWSLFSVSDEENVAKLIKNRLHMNIYAITSEKLVKVKGNIVEILHDRMLSTMACGEECNLKQ